MIHVTIEGGMPVIKIILCKRRHPPENFQNEGEKNSIPRRLHFKMFVKTMLLKTMLLKNMLLKKVQLKKLVLKSVIFFQQEIIH